MMSISAMTSGQGKYYTRLARKDYYTAGGEPPGIWWGEGAQRLGLAGQMVEPPVLDRLLEGFTPGTPKTALVQNAGKEDRRPGHDVVFSAPKSVSALWALAPRDTQVKIQQAHAAAVMEALTHLERVAGRTRRGKAGARVESARWAVGVFEHGTSRAGDPQLHSHCLILNLGLREDGTWGSLLSEGLYDHKMTAGALYRAALAHALTHTVGVRCVADRFSFRVEGVPEALVAQWSKRREQIEAVLEEHGLETASAAAFAALVTRDVKELVPPREVLFARWVDEARPHGHWIDRVLGTGAGGTEPAAAEALDTATHPAQSRREAQSLSADGEKEIADNAVHDRKPRTEHALDEPSSHPRAEESPNQSYDATVADPGGGQDQQAGGSDSSSDAGFAGFDADHDQRRDARGRARGAETREGRAKAAPGDPESAAYKNKWQQKREEAAQKRESKWRRRAERLSSRDPTKLVRETIRFCAQDLTAGQSFFSERKLTTAVLNKLAPYGIHPQTVMEEISRPAKRLAPLVTLFRTRDGRVFTTESVLREERDLLRSASQLTRQRGAGLSSARARKRADAMTRKRSLVALACQAYARKMIRQLTLRKTEPVDLAKLRERAALVLTQEQADAVAKLVSRDGSRLRMLSGVAGAGKTKTIKAVEEILAAEGFRVIGAALAGTAAKQLVTETGIQSHTYALLQRIMHPTLMQRVGDRADQLLRLVRGEHVYAIERLKFDRKTVLVVDEASMLDNHQLGRLLHDVQRGGGTVLILGDQGQVQAIGRGGGFHSLLERHGSAELTQIQRQTDEADREFVRLVNEGKGREAVDSLLQRGRLTVTPQGESASQKLVRAWVKDVLEHGFVQPPPILTATNEKVDELNRLCQQAMLDEGLVLGGPRGTSVSHGGAWFHVGDRVLLKETSGKLKVNNGDMATIESIERTPLGKALVVTLDEGGTRRLDLGAYPAVRHGYAITVHAAQGQTFGRDTYVLLGSQLQDRELTYVQGSRSVQRTHFFADHSFDADRLVCAIENSRQKSTATDELERLRAERVAEQRDANRRKEDEARRREEQRRREEEQRKKNEQRRHARCHL